LGNQIKKTEGQGVLHIWGEERCIEGFSGGDLREGDDLEDPAIAGRLLLKWICRKLDWGEVAGTGSIWLRIGTGGGLL
jgi:hypothetical protein